MTRAVVTGAGGFIGGHLVKRLVADGYSVRAVDIKPLDQWYQVSNGADNFDRCDLRLLEPCMRMCAEADEVFNLAASMGGIGHIESHHYECAMNVLISAHMLQAAIDHKVKRFFFSSSACVFHRDRQLDPAVASLREEDAYYNGGCAAEIGYGEEKLYTEWLCRYAMEDTGLQTRVARFFNIMGPYGTWDGGREKAPAAICRKVIEAIDTGSNSIDIWGDGTQSRNFTWIDDCINGIIRLMRSDVKEPLNLGSSEMVTINELVSMVEDIAGVKLQRTYSLDAPKGVRGRNSDNTKIKALLGWEPTTPLAVGLSKTYPWIKEQYEKRKAGMTVVE
jgi:nucleoside-diphosphate-sugar epimerase